MPGVDTHYFFGLDALSHMDDSWSKKCSQEFPSSFAYGLQGPDIFFFFTFVHFANKKNLGTLIHTELVTEFFQNMLRYILHLEGEEQRIGLAYFAGFLGHYALDTNVHPFVYGRTNYQEEDPLYHSRHVFLETDLNTKVLAKFTGLKPSEFRQSKTMRITWRENKVVRKVLLYAISKTYPDYVHFPVLMPYAMYLMSLCTQGLVDNQHGHKKYLFRLLEGKFAKRPLLSPLIGSDRFQLTKDPYNLRHDKWQNPWAPMRESRADFWDLYQTAQREYLQMLLSLDAYVLHRTRDNRNDLFTKIGNRSYHSGLSL